MARHGMARQARRGQVRLVKAPQGRHGVACPGWVWPGKAWQARQGKARHGMSWQARQGAAGLGKSGRGTAGVVSPGEFQLGTARQAGQGLARHGGSRPAWKKGSRQ